MKTIGIDTDNYLVYEGNGTWGHALWPTPAILPAAIVDESSDDLSPVNNNNLQKLPFIFIDEGYDPVSRVRKGRIYEKNESQLSEWWVQPHPATPADIKHKNEDGVLNKSLATFREFNFQPVLNQLDISIPLIVLGSNTQFTIWSVIDVETSISGETILFLKARKTIGVLPKINYSAIDEKYHSQIKDKLARLADDIYKAGPDSIIDRSREAASAILNTWLLENDYIEKHKDLGQLVLTLRDRAKKHVVANCADTLAKFHSRTKHSEQEKLSVRHLNEIDAEYAIQTVVVLLHECGYVRGQ